MPKIFSRRLNDFEKLSAASESDRTKSLLKKEEHFIKDPSQPMFEGAKSYGPYKKMGKQGQEKIYYVSPHIVEEYFGLEVLNRIGFNTEKLRFIPNGRWTSRVAAKQISEYMPIGAFIHERSYESLMPQTILKHPALLANFRRYKLDIPKQVVVNIETNEEYKISGNLFTSDIGARLLGDMDLQPEDSNIGLVKRGNRFYAYMIDKDQIQPNAGYDEFDYRAFKSQIYKKNTRDQQLFIVNEIRRALEQCDFRKICDNARTMQTPPLVKSVRTWSDNFEASAKRIVARLTTGEECDAFEKREAIRERLAQIIIERLPYDLEEKDKDSLQMIIMEDLRAPYYLDKCIKPDDILEDDLSNEGLISTIVEDQTQELTLLEIPKKPPHQQPVDELTVSCNAFKKNFESKFAGHTNSTGIKKVLELIEQTNHLEPLAFLEQIKALITVLYNSKAPLPFFRKEGADTVIQELYEYLSESMDSPKTQFEDMSALITEVDDTLNHSSPNISR